MAPRTFVPWVEQLECRMPLTVAAEGMPLSPATFDYVDSTVMKRADRAAHEFAVEVRTEEAASGHILIVQFKHLDGPRTIGIRGGDMGRTAADGTVRLPQPPNVTTLELTISDANDVHRLFWRIELDAKGHILSHGPIGPDMPTETLNHSDVRAESQLMSRGHISSAHDMQSSSSRDRIVRNSHNMSGRMVDEAIAHFGMPSMAGMSMQYSPTSGHANMASVDSTPSISEQDEREMFVDHDAIDMEMPAVAIRLDAHDQPAESETEEYFFEFESVGAAVVDAALVSWVHESLPEPTEDNNNFEAPAGTVIETELEMVRLDQLGQSAQTFPIAAICSPPIKHTVPLQKAADQTSGMLRCLTSLAIAVIGLAGVFVLERRASRASL